MASDLDLGPGGAVARCPGIGPVGAAQRVHDVEIDVTIDDEGDEATEEEEHLAVAENI